METTILYELGLHFDLAYILTIAGGLGILTFVVWRGFHVLEKERKDRGRHDKWTVVWIAFTCCLELAAIFGFIVQPMLDYRAAWKAYKSGNVQIAKGPVECYRSWTDIIGLSHYEEFSVEGVRFCHDEKVYTTPGLPGYRMEFSRMLSSRGGSVITGNGQMLRIQYVIFPDRGRDDMPEYKDFNCIVQIEELS